MKQYLCAAAISLLPMAAQAYDESAAIARQCGLGTLIVDQLYSELDYGAPPHVFDGLMLLYLGNLMPSESVFGLAAALRQWHAQDLPRDQILDSFEGACLKQIGDPT
jgi:hypothetical protein